MDISKLPKDKQIILFDVVCNLCDSSVQYIIRHDKKDVFRFVALQSELGIQILRHIGENADSIETVILYSAEGNHYIKSDAAIEILKQLGLTKISWLLSLSPKFIRNKIYSFIARNRYKWFGKKDSCLVPTESTKAKFIE